MPNPESLPPKQRSVLAAQAVAEHDTTPVTELTVPLAQARLAVVTSAGLNLRSQPPFRREDPGFRVLPSATPPGEIVQSHSSIGFDRTATARDLNVVYPVDRLRELVGRGRIGELAPRFVSFMGAQPDPAATLAASAEQAADLLLADAVDLVVLTPT
jgi:D-proline reductase (dithiol) PrdB